MKRTKKHLYYAFLYTVSIIVVLALLFPIINMILTSVQSRLYIFENVHPRYHFIPREITLTNYVSVIIYQNIFRPMYNSFIVSLITAIIVGIVAVMGAYSFSRFNIRFSEIAIFVLIFLKLIPEMTTAIPFFMISKKLGLYDTKAILIIMHSAVLLPYSILIIKGVIDKIPYELEESALIDGCNHSKTLMKIVVPLSKAGIVTIFIYTFLGTWNSFLMPLILTSQKVPTIQIALAQNITADEIRWNLLTSSGVIALIPVIVLALAFQKQIISGITEGALKG